MKTVERASGRTGGRKKGFDGKPSQDKRSVKAEPFAILNNRFTRSRKMLPCELVQRLGTHRQPRPQGPRLVGNLPAADEWIGDSGSPRRASWFKFRRDFRDRSVSTKQKTPGLASGRLVKTEFRRLPELAGVKFDDELLVDERINIGAVRDAGNGDFELVLVHGEPVFDRHGLREVGHAVD